MWWSCDENIILQLRTVIEDDLILVNPSQFRLRQIFDPATVQESLDLFANDAACRRNWMGLRCEEVNLSSLLYFIADHPNILSLAKTCWTTLYFLGLAPAEHQPLERWGKGDSQSGLYNGNKA